MFYISQNLKKDRILECSTIFDQILYSHNKNETEEKRRMWNILEQKRRNKKKKKIYLSFFSIFYW